MKSQDTNLQIEALIKMRVKANRDYLCNKHVMNTQITICAMFLVFLQYFLLNRLTNYK